MSRVHTDQHYINVFHKDNFNFGPSKMTRSKGCNPDYRKAATLSYKAYRRKSTHRRQELRKEFEKDTGRSSTNHKISNI